MKVRTILKLGVIGLIILAFYALLHFNPFNQGKGGNLLTQGKENSKEGKGSGKEYVFKIRNEVILIDDTTEKTEKNLEELSGVFLEIQKNKNNTIKLRKNGKEKTGFMEKIIKQIGDSGINWSIGWEGDKEPEWKLKE